MEAESDPDLTRLQKSNLEAKGQPPGGVGPLHFHREPSVVRLAILPSSAERCPFSFVLPPANPRGGTHSGSTDSEQRQTDWLGNSIRRCRGVGLKRQEPRCQNEANKNESAVFKKLHHNASSVVKLVLGVLLLASMLTDELCRT